MVDSFSLDIDLGNAAMRTPQDVAAALRATAATLDDVDASEWEDGDVTIPAHSESGDIRDDNGNRVGGWGFDQLNDKRPGVPVNRHVLAAMCFLLEGGQHARAKRYALGGFDDTAAGLRRSGEAFRALGQRIDAGTIEGADVSEALDRHLTA